MIALFIQLLMGHAMADFGLQSQAMAKGKNRNVPKDYIPPGQTPNVCWPYYLVAHGLIHGFFVFLFTGSVWLGAAETVTHASIDFGKCDNHYGIHFDQTLHVLCKVLWVYLAMR